MADYTNNNKNARAVSGRESQNSINLSEQFVFTHCRQDESCNGEAGFQMRLRSCDNPQMQEFTANLSYEPLDTQMRNPEVSPHRLAWLRFSGNGTDKRVLAHSRYLGRDTEGRWGNFVTRTIFFEEKPRVSLKRVLRCCDSPLWDDLNFGNKGIEFSEKFRGVPEPGHHLGEQQLQAFLRSEQLPGRLGQLAPRERQRLLAWTSTACLKSLNFEQFRHVYIHGEPPLVAMLLYGVATILPEGFMRQLTFSTYEKPGQKLRSFQSALVIGTITDHPEEGLHDDFLAQQGLIIDTFEQTCSPEAQTPLFDHLDDYIFLAANGEWNKLRELHSLVSLAETTTTKTLGQAWQVHADRELLSTNANSLPDREICAALKRLQSLELGRKLFRDEIREDNETEAVKIRQRCRDVLWGLVRDQCARDEILVNEFHEVLIQPRALRQHHEEIVKRICDNDKSWLPAWRLYRSIRNNEARADLTAILVVVNKRLESNSRGTLDFSHRVDLLREYQQLSSGTGNLDPQHAWLLYLQDAQNVWEFSTIDPPFPAAWIGQALAVSIGDQTANEISQFLLNSACNGDADMGIWSGFKASFEQDSIKTRKSKLQQLFKAQPSEVVNLFFLLRDRLSLELGELDPSFLIPLLEDYSKQLDASPRRHFGWMHHWNDIRKLDAIRPYLGRNAVSAKIITAALESIGLGLLMSWPPAESSLEEIEKWVRKNKILLPDEVLKRLGEIRNKKDKLARLHISRRVLICICICVGFALGLFSYWLLEKWSPVIWSYLTSWWGKAN